MDTTKLKNLATGIGGGIALGGGSGALFIDGLLRLADGNVVGAIEILASFVGADLAKDCFNRFAEHRAAKKASKLNIGTGDITAQSGIAAQSDSIVTMYVPTNNNTVNRLDM